MSQPPDREARVAALEARVGDVAADVRVARDDAVAARHLAAARDRDLADLAVKVDANRSAINALGAQTREQLDAMKREMRDGFAEMRDGFRKVDDAFIEVRGQLDATAAWYEQTTRLLNTIIDQQRRQLDDQ